MQYSQFISGIFRPGKSTEIFTVLDPSNGKSLGSYPHATPADVEEAIHSARQAFHAWKNTSALERSKLLRQIATLLRERSSGFSTQISKELGKPLEEAAKEVSVAAEMFEWAAEEARRLYGRTIPSRQNGQTQLVLYEPIGPVAAFSGWNAPLNTPARKISGALGAGCTIVLKPSEETAGVALLLAQVVQDAGLPAGVVNMVFGDPGQIADILCASPLISMVTFTGATSIGKIIGSKAALAMKRSTLELGGHAPVIVCDDVDIDTVVQKGVAAKYRNTGQICVSPTRFLIQTGIFEQFCEKFTQAVEKIKVGNPFDNEVQMGPLKNLRRLQAIESLVEDARTRGMKIATGGERLGDEGYFYKPTVIVQPALNSQAANIEPFGPIALLSSFETLDGAIAEANRLPFGLAAYAHTNRLDYAHRLMHELESGVVCINEWQASLPETPFGGHKDSGFGSEGGIEGLQEFLKTKCVRQNSTP